MIPVPQAKEEFMLKIATVMLALGSASVGCGGNDVPETTTKQAVSEPAATFIVYTLPG